MPQPDYAPDFSAFTLTPAVCALCGTPACATNPERPERAVLTFFIMPTEQYEFPPIQIGARCWKSNGYEVGAPTPEDVQRLKAQLQAAEEAVAEAQARATTAEERTRDLEGTAWDEVKTLLDRGLSTAGIAGANAAKKALGPAA